MADTKISALAAASAAAGANEIAINEAGTSKKLTVTQIEKFLGIQKTTLSSAYTNSTTTGTEVTGLSFAGLAAGTYHVKWVLLFQTAATSTSVAFGVNYTGNVTTMSVVLKFPSAGVTAATGTWEDELNVTTGAVWAHLRS